jgi:hypothetical protein
MEQGNTNSLFYKNNIQIKAAHEFFKIITRVKIFFFNSKNGHNKNWNTFTMECLATKTLKKYSEK